MALVGLATDFHRRDMQLRASDAAVRVWVCSMTASVEAGRSAQLSGAQATALILGLRKKPAKVVPELLELGAWTETPGGGFDVQGFDMLLPGDIVEEE